LDKYRQALDSLFATLLPESDAAARILSVNHRHTL
jgi:hypothetical protein